MNVLDRGPRLKVVAVAKYPPLRGLPHGESPIDGALERYSRDAGVEIEWVFPSNSERRTGWHDKLRQGKVEFRTFTWGFSLFGAIHGLCKLVRGWPPRACLHVMRSFEPQTKEMTRAVQDRKPDVIYVGSPDAAMAFGRRWDIPVVYNSIDSLTFRAANGALGTKRGMTRRLLQWWTSNLDRDLCVDKDLVIFVTERDRRNAPHVGQCRSIAIPNGCDVERFSPAGVRAKAHEPLIAYVGSRRYPPNVAAMKLLVSEIAPLVWKTAPQANFCFIGADNEVMPGQFGLADDRLIFRGYVDDLNQELNRAWLALIPLDGGGGIKNKVLDAMACGLPVVGFEEAFNGIPDRGAYVKCQTPRECARAVLALIGDPERRRAMGARGREHAEDVSWRTQANRYYAEWRRLYNDNLDGGNRVAAMGRKIL